MGVPPEVKDPILLHAWTHKTIGYWGAVRLRDGKLVYRREPGTFEGPTYAAFLEQFYRASTRGPRRAVVIGDNASYHHSRIHKDWRAQQAGRFELSFLSAASPELNRIERVWKLTRRRCLHNRYFPTLDSITEAVESTFDEWRSPNETLRRLCAITQKSIHNNMECHRGRIVWFHSGCTSCSLRLILPISSSEIFSSTSYCDRSSIAFTFSPVLVFVLPIRFTTVS